MKFNDVVCLAMLVFLPSCSSSEASVESVSALCDSYCAYITTCSENNDNADQDVSGCAVECLEGATASDDPLCLAAYEEILVCGQELSCSDLMAEGGTLACLPEDVPDTCFTTSSQTVESSEP